MTGMPCASASSAARTSAPAANAESTARPLCAYTVFNSRSSPPNAARSGAPSAGSTSRWAVTPTIRAKPRAPNERGVATARASTRTACGGSESAHQIVVVVLGEAQTAAKRLALPRLGIGARDVFAHVPQRADQVDADVLRAVAQSQRDAVAWNILRPGAREKRAGECGEGEVGRLRATRRFR